MKLNVLPNAMDEQNCLVHITDVCMQKDAIKKLL